jgi:hypothetical protein
MRLQVVGALGVVVRWEGENLDEEKHDADAEIHDGISTISLISVSVVLL